MHPIVTTIIYAARNVFGLSFHLISANLKIQISRTVTLPVIAEPFVFSAATFIVRNMLCIYSVNWGQSTQQK
jgi:hypothetical protein